MSSVSETAYFSVPTMRSMTDKEQDILHQLGANDKVEYRFAEKMLKLDRISLKRIQDPVKILNLGPGRDGNTSSCVLLFRSVNCM